MSRQADDRQVQQQALRGSIAAVLSRMSPEARKALADRMETLSKEQFAELADDQVKATALALRQRLSRDVAAAEAILTRPFQDRFTNEDTRKTIAEVQRLLQKAHLGIPTVDQLGAADPEQIKKAARHLRSVYTQLEPLAIWETFCDAVEKLKTEQVRQQQEEQEKQQKEQAHREKAARDHIEDRNRSILRNSSNGGPGRDDANVKCVMILPDGTSQQGHCGGKAKRATSALHPALDDLLTYVTSKGWDRDNCAEVDAMNELLYKHYAATTGWGQIPNGIVSRAFEYRSGVWSPRTACANCAQWLTRIKADFR